MGKPSSASNKITAQQQLDAIKNSLNIKSLKRREAKEKTEAYKLIKPLIQKFPDTINIDEIIQIVHSTIGKINKYPKYKLASQKINVSDYKYLDEDKIKFILNEIVKQADIHILNHLREGFNIYYENIFEILKLDQIKQYVYIGYGEKYPVETWNSFSLEQIRASNADIAELKTTDPKLYAILVKHTLHGKSNVNLLKEYFYIFQSMFSEQGNYNSVDELFAKINHVIGGKELFSNIKFIYNSCIDQEGMFRKILASISFVSYSWYYSWRSEETAKRSERAVKSNLGEIQSVCDILDDKKKSRLCSIYY